MATAAEELRNRKRQDAMDVINEAKKNGFDGTLEYSWNKDEKVVDSAEKEIPQTETKKDIMEESDPGSEGNFVFKKKYDPSRQKNRNGISNTSNDVTLPSMSDYVISGSELAEKNELERKRNVKTYLQDLPPEVYKQINDQVVETYKSQGDKAAKDLAFKYANALAYSQAMSVPLSFAFENVDNFNQYYFGGKTGNEDYVTNWKAISDAYEMGTNISEMSKIGNKLAAAEMNSKNSLWKWGRYNSKSVQALWERQQALQKYNETLSDNIPRNLFIEACKAAAETIPYTVQVALPSMATQAVGLGPLGGVVVGYDLTFGTEYIEFRQAGFSPDAAYTGAQISAAGQVAIENMLGEIAGALGTSISKPVVQRISSSITGSIANEFIKNGAKLGVTYLLEAGEEGAEEAAQKWWSYASMNITKALADEDIDLPEAGQIMQGAWEEAKGAFLGSLILGIPATVRTANVTVSDFKTVKDAAEKAPDAETLAKVIDKSPVVEGMTQEQKKEFAENLFESEQKKRETLAELDVAESKDLASQAEGVATDEEGNRIVKTAEFREESGELHIEKDESYAEISSGKEKGRYLLGDPTRLHSLEEDGNRYGYIDYTVKGNKVTIDNFKMSPGREKLAPEFFRQFAREFVGKDIVWKPKQETNLNLKKQLVESNPNGKGLNYYRNENDIQEVKTFNRIAKDLSKKFKDQKQLTAGTALIMAIMKKIAKDNNMTVDEAIDALFADGKILTDLIPEEFKNQNPKEGLKLGSTQRITDFFVTENFKKINKALVYVSEYGDINTLAHELMHAIEPWLSDEDLETIKKLLGEKDWHEKLADIWGDYLESGKSPLKELEKVLKAIKEFFQSFVENYSRGFQGKLKLSPELEKIFGNILSEADETIEKQADIAASNAVNQNKAKEVQQNDNVEETTTEDIITSKESTIEEKADAVQEEASEERKDIIPDDQFFQIVSLYSFDQMTDKDFKKAAEELWKRAVNVYESHLAQYQDPVQANLVTKMLTGWQKDSDGEWKYETDDSINQLNVEAIERIMKLSDEELEKVHPTLSQIYSAPELYKFYPTLKPLTVNFTRRGNAEYRAVFGNKGISINLSNIPGLKGPLGLKGSLCYAIQQAITTVDTRLKDKAANVVRDYDLSSNKKYLDPAAEKLAAESRKAANRVDFDRDERNSTLFQILGEKGALNLDRINEVHELQDAMILAKEMEESGKDAKTIRLATGWEKGVDGKWKYETAEDIQLDTFGMAQYSRENPKYRRMDDLEEKWFNDDITAEEEKELNELYDTIARPDVNTFADKLINSYATLKDVIKNDELLAAYPGLGDVKLYFGKIKGDYNTKGMYSPEENAIILFHTNPESLSWSKAQNTISVLTHEIQHWIQNYEGFATGGNENLFETNTISRAKIETEIDRIKKERNELIFSIPSEEFIQLDKKLTETSMTEEEYKNARYDIYQKYEVGPKIISLSEEIESLQDRISEIEENALDGQVELEDGRLYEDTFAAYRSLAGEVEARNVQSRIGMSAEDRLNSLLEDSEDIDRDQQIIMYQTLVAESKKDWVKRDNDARELLTSYPEAERKRIIENFDRLYMTPWHKQAIEGILIDADMEELMNGLEMTHGSKLGAPTAKDIADAVKGGWEGIRKYLKKTGIIGGAEKAVNAVNSEFKNCNPSEECAKYCYAASGNYAFPAPAVKSALVTKFIEKFPADAAKITYDEYAPTLEFEAGKALRLFDKGDISEAWLPYIEELNKKGIKTQIFSKRPDILRKVDSNNNVIMLSIDHSNLAMALDHANDDLPIAYVYQGIEDISFIENNKERFEKHGGVILPVKIGNEVLDHSYIEALPAWARPYCCPIDSGHAVLNYKKEENEGKPLWNCLRCNTNGGIGCFYHRVTTVKAQLEKLNDTPLNERDYGGIEENVKELEKLITEGNLAKNGKLAEQLSRTLASLVSQIRSGYDPETEKGSVDQTRSPLRGQTGDVAGNREAVSEGIETQYQTESIRSQFMNTDKWLKAPNGKDTNLTEEQWLQVRTEKFKEWFGDWENDPANASKVVDENGEPQVVYHGSPYFFEEFDFKKLGSKSGHDNSKRGFYFVSNKEIADHYGRYWKNDMEAIKKSKTAQNLYNKALELIQDEKQYVKEINLSRDNKGDLVKDYEYWTGAERKQNLMKLWDEAIFMSSTGKIQSSSDEIMNILSEEDPGNYNNYLRRLNKLRRDFVAFDTNVYPCYLNIRNPVTSDPYASIDDQHDGLAVKDITMNVGSVINYAGKDFKTDMYIVSKGPSQIKSATDNNGEFSADNSSILYQTAYHGSGADFEKFDLSYGLSGEGSMSFGYGAYVTNDREIALDYAERQRKKIESDKKNPFKKDSIEYKMFEDLRSFNFDKTKYGNYLTKEIEELKKDTIENPYIDREAEEKLKKLKDLKINPTNLYTVEIPDGEYIVWDKEESKDNIERIKKALFDILVKGDYAGAEKDLTRELDDVFTESLTGEVLYNNVIAYTGSQKEASDVMHKAGFVGIDYPAGTNFGPDTDARNYVIFDADDIEITDHIRFQEVDPELAQLFQSESELLDDAARFNSWEEFKDFYETGFDFNALDDPEYHSQVPSDADDAWYKKVWERAHQIAEQNEYNDEYVQEVRQEDVAHENERDEEWFKFIQEEGNLDDFLRAIDYESTYDPQIDEAQPSDQEEADELQRRADLRDRYNKEIRHGTWRDAAWKARQTKPGETVPITDRQRKQLITLMRNSKRDYRDLYASFMNDPSWEVIESAAEEIVRTKIASPDSDFANITEEQKQEIIADIEAMTPEKRREVVAGLDFDRLKKELKNGTLEMNLDNLEIFIKGYEDQIKILNDRIDAIKKQKDDNAELAVKQYAQLEKLMAEKEEKMQAKIIAENIREIKVRLIKAINKKVDWKTINFDTGKKIIAIQALFQPALRKFVNRFLNSEVYLRDAYSRYQTEYEYRARMDMLAHRSRGNAIKKVVNLLKNKSFEKWTKDEMEYVAKHLPKTNWVEELDLDRVEKDRDASLQLDLQTEENQALLKEALPDDYRALLLSKDVRNWTLEQMEGLATIVDGLRKVGREELRIKNEARIEAAEKQRNAIDKEIKSSGIVINPDDPEWLKDKKKKNIEKFNKEKLPDILGLGAAAKGTLEHAKDKQRGAFKRIINGYGDANVRRVARILDNDKEGANTTLLFYREDECFNAEQKAITSRTKKITDAMKSLGITVEELYKPVEINYYSGEKEYISYKDSFNKDHKLTMDEVLYIMAASEDEKSRLAVACGNLVTAEEKDSYKQLGEKGEQDCYDAGAARMDEIIKKANNIDPKWRKFLAVIQDDYAEQYERMNRVSIEEFNQPVARVNNYVPLNRLESNGDTNVNRVKEDLLGSSAVGGANWVDKGMTKSRVDIAPTNQKPVAMGLYSTWADSLNRTEHFLNYASYVRELNRVYKSRDAQLMRNHIENKFSKDMLTYIDEYIQELANPDVSSAQNQLDRIARALRGKTASAYLAWKTSAIVKQFCTSPWPYMRFVSPVKYLASMFDFMRNPSKMSDLIKSKSAYMNSRRFDPIADLIDEQKKKATNKVSSALASFENMGMQGLEMVDWVCVAPGWLACYKEEFARLSSDKEQKKLIDARRKELKEFADVEGMDWVESEAQKAALSEGEIERLAVRKADDLTRQCQPSNRLTDLSPIFKQRGPGSEIGRIFLQFTTSLNVIWQNIRYDLPSDVRHGEFRRVLMTVAAYALAGITMGLVTEGLDDDDDDENADAKQIAYYGSTQFTDSIPVIGSVVTAAVKQLITGKKNYSQGVSDIFPQLTKISRGLASASEGKWANACSNFGYALALSLGLPVSGAKELGAAAGIGDDEEGLSFNPEAFAGRR